MRRPAKPFVTEYRASGRRGKDPEERRTGGRGEETGRDTLAPRELFRPSISDPAGGYDAAMRAADALFSPRAKPERLPEPERSASMPAAAETPLNARDGAEQTGRVLQALDEPVVEPLGATVDTTLPRRRGRKPGSRNKPKMTDAGRQAVSEAAAQPRRLVLPVHGYAASDQPIDMHDAPEQSTIASRREPDTDRPSSLAASPRPATPKRREPFFWIQKTLGPGEKWKRRLPKIAW